MCMIHAPINRKTPSVPKKREKKKKALAFDKKLLKPDPDFIDERIVKNETPKKLFFSL